MTEELSILKVRLNDFDLNTRRQALQALLEQYTPNDLSFNPAQDKSVNLPLANMYCHTFFSFNGYDHSPTSLAWLNDITSS